MHTDINLTALCAGTRFVCVDIETTDSDTGKHIVSIGVAPWTLTGGLRGAFEKYANPGVPIETTFVHGISDADVASEPRVRKHLPDLDKALKATAANQRVVFVAHFASSDLATLKLEYARARRTFPDLAVLDTHALARHLTTGRGGYALTEVLAAYGLTATQHHNALADATDAARILERLLRTAAEAGHNDLLALIAEAQGDRLRTTNYEAGGETRTAPRDHAAAFVFIERSDEHINGHRKLKKNASVKERTAWFGSLRECVTLRCPLMLARVEGLPDHHAQVATALLSDLRVQAAAGDTVDANTTLLALLGSLRGAQLDKDQAVRWYDQLKPALTGHTRCVSVTTARQDGCPACRGDRACPADTWPHGLTRAATTRSNTTRYLHTWTRPGGHLEHTAAARPDYAAALARVIATRLHEAGADAEPLGAATARLGIVEPKVTHVVARALVKQALRRRAHAHRHDAGLTRWLDGPGVERPAALPLSRRRASAVDAAPGSVDEASRPRGTGQPPPTAPVHARHVEPRCCTQLPEPGLRGLLQRSVYGIHVVAGARRAEAKPPDVLARHRTKLVERSVNFG